MNTKHVDVLSVLARFLPKRVATEELGDLIQGWNAGSLSRTQLALNVALMFWNALVYKLRQATKRSGA